MQLNYAYESRTQVVGIGIGSRGRVTNSSSSTKNSTIGPNIGNIGSVRGGMGEGKASIEEGRDREQLGL